MLFKVISACKAVGGKLVVLCKLRLVRQSVEWAVAIGALIAFGILAKPHVRFVEAAVQSAFASPTVGFLLKLIAGIATAGFGILGIGAKTRDDSGRLTKEGTIALTGIVLSALIGAASSVYDFTSAQRSAADERKKSERLLLSVQRGIYPLRGITGDVAIRFKNDFIGLAKYRSLLRNSLPAKGCKDAKEYFCYSDEDRGAIYGIPRASPLYPSAASKISALLKHIGIRVVMASLHNTGNVRKYSAIGTLHFVLGDLKPARSFITIDLRNGEFGYRSEGFRIPDSTILKSNVYSLVELFPGFIAANAEGSGEPPNYGFCDDYLSISDGHTCETSVLEPLKGMELGELLLKFDYPKALDIYSERRIRCSNEVGNTIVLVLSDDIEELDTYGRMHHADPEPEEERNICTALNTHEFRF